MHYPDASGLKYEHDGDAEMSGDLVKVRYQLSDSQTITVSFLNSIRDRHRLRPLRGAAGAAVRRWPQQHERRQRPAVLTHR